MFLRTGEFAESNGFLSPQWGGFIIYNVKRDTKEGSPKHITLELKHVMKTFLEQLRLLIGIPPKVELLTIV